MLFQFTVYVVTIFFIHGINVLGSQKQRKLDIFLSCVKNWASTSLLSSRTRLTPWTRGKRKPSTWLQELPVKAGPLSDLTPRPPRIPTNHGT